jgi:hypothetical protein
MSVTAIAERPAACDIPTLQNHVGGASRPEGA